MKKICFIWMCACLCVGIQAQIDMQAPMGSDEAKEAYSVYINKQSAYYIYPKRLHKEVADTLFGSLNEIMGNTCLLSAASYDYNKLRQAYVGVDKDLNTPGNIIGFYDGSSFSGTWDNGTTWNREHVWPQAKGESKDGCMGYDMQAVRPALTEQNSDRGSTAYGESNKYYDPGTLYRGDAARIILYDYVVYGQMEDHQNDYYNGKAQLLNKFGKNGVFESLRVLLKWHMRDPVSLTEMVRNDGAQDYQGNRNPFIDYPEIAINLFKYESGIQLYGVTTKDVTLWPAYKLTLSDGFVGYLTTADGHPATELVQISGASYSYDAENGRLDIYQVTGPLSVALRTSEGVEEINVQTQAEKVMENGQIYILRGDKKYTIFGLEVAQ